MKVVVLIAGIVLACAKYVIDVDAVESSATREVYRMSTSEEWALEESNE